MFNSTGQGQMRTTWTFPSYQDVKGTQPTSTSDLGRNYAICPPLQVRTLSLLTGFCGVIGVLGGRSKLPLLLSWGVSMWELWQVTPILKVSAETWWDPWCKKDLPSPLNDSWAWVGNGLYSHSALMRWHPSPLPERYQRRLLKWNSWRASRVS